MLSHLGLLCNALRELLLCWIPARVWGWQATNLSCVCRSLLYKTTEVWITLQGDGWKEPCQTPPGALSRKIHYAFISWTSASHQEKAFWCQGLVLPFGKRDLCTILSASLIVFKTNSEATLPSSHCSEFGTELDWRGWLILSMTNHSQSLARMLTEYKGGPSGVAQAAKLLTLKPLSSQTAISTVQMKINHCQC